MGNVRERILNQVIIRSYPSENQSESKDWFLFISNKKKEVQGRLNVRMQILNLHLYLQKQLKRGRAYV